MQPSGSEFVSPISMTFDLATHEVAMSSEVSSLCCPHCEDPLDLHQPDPREAAKLLGTCESCDRWYFLVEIDAEWNRALLLELPGAGDIHTRLGTKLASA